MRAAARSPEGILAGEMAAFNDLTLRSLPSSSRVPSAAPGLVSPTIVTPRSVELPSRVEFGFPPVIELRRHCRPRWQRQ